MLNRLISLLLSLWWAALPAEPPVSLDDLSRFPPESTAAYVVSLGGRCEDWFRFHRATDLRRSHRWDAALYDLHACRGPWKELYESARSQQWDAGPEQPASARLDALLRLRRLIGRDAYHLGRMPPPIPVWWFEVID